MKKKSYTWTGFVDQLRKNFAYKGEGDFESVRSFIDDNGIEIECPVDLSTLQKHKTVMVTATAGEEIAVVPMESAEVESAKEMDEDDEEDKAKSADLSKRLDAIEKRLEKPNRKTLSVDAKVFHQSANHKAYKRDIKNGKAVFDDCDSAETFGALVKIALGRGGADDFAICKNYGCKTQVENINASGGVLVPEDFQATLIDLREQYGAFRMVARNERMTRDTQRFPRRTSSVTVYQPGEATAITASDTNYDSVELIARKWAVMTKVSSELLEDAAINVADDVAKDMAMRLAEKEDDCGFNGDGTSTYFGVQGIRNALKGLSGTIANIAGLVVGSGNAYSELTLSDFQKVVGRAPAYVDASSPSWVMHKQFYWEVCDRLALAAGGVTGTEIVGGIQRPRFLGYPVMFSQVMPRTEANSQVCALFGAFDMGAKLGLRRDLTIAQSDQRYFDEDVVAIRAIERLAINVHDVGNADATAASRVPGPIVGLITAAS